MQRTGCTSLLVFALSISCSSVGIAQPSPAALSSFNSYVQSIEAGLAQQHRSPSGFLGGPFLDRQSQLRLRAGQVILDKIDPPGPQPPGAMLHVWRGTAFIPGATADQFESLLKDLGAYPRVFSPQVLRAAIIPAPDRRGPDHFQARMRIRQHHILTVVLDTTYDVQFARLDEQHRYSASRSTQVSEIDSPGTRSEHPLGPTQEHGFLWRINTYWSWTEQDGGVYVQIESISLTRSIPTGLGWAVGPFVESIPHESLDFTLRAVCRALAPSRPGATLQGARR